MLATGDSGLGRRFSWLKFYRLFWTSFRSRRLNSDIIPSKSGLVECAGSSLDHGSLSSASSQKATVAQTVCLSSLLQRAPLLCNFPSPRSNSFTFPLYICCVHISEQLYGFHAFFSNEEDGIGKASRNVSDAMQQPRSTRLE